MKTPDFALNTGQMYNWLKENERELFTQWKTDIEKYKGETWTTLYYEWKYNLLGRNQKRVEQSLKLGYFIPCNKKGEPIEYPKIDRIPSKLNVNLITPTKELLEFEQAEQDVLFPGYELVKGTNYITLKDPNKSTMYMIDYIKKEEPLSDLNKKLRMQSVESLIRKTPNIPISKTYYQPIFKI